MEIFNEIWVWLFAALGGISMTSIITAVIIGCLKGALIRLFQKSMLKKLPMTQQIKALKKSKKYLLNKVFNLLLKVN